MGVSAGANLAMAGFLSGGGAMGEAIAAQDWSASALGPLRDWPPELKSALATILASPEPTFLAWGQDLTFLFNDAYRTALGPGIDAALGRPAREHWAEVWPALSPYVEGALGGRASRVEDFAIPVKRKSGKIRQTWWSFVYTPARDADGLVRGVIGTVAETTEQVVLRKHAGEERERQLSLLRQMPGFVAVLRGKDHVYDYANDAYFAISGGRPLLGLSVRQAFPELESQGFYERLDRVYNTGEAFASRESPVRLSGQSEPRYVDLVYEPIRSGDGAVAGIFIGGYDVTDRVRAQQALTASEAEFRTFAQAMPNHVWASGADGMLDWFNDRVYEYSAAAPGALDGEGWVALVHPDDRAAAGERWAAALKSGETYETEFRLRRADGVYRWHIARALPIRDDDGSILRWIGSNTDIADQKTTADALAHLNATLEQQVEARTAELMAVEEALRQSQKMDAVGQLTGGIAHDFNNMLAVVIGSLDLARRRIDAEDQRVCRHIDAAAEGARRAATLTQRLLAFSRQQPLQPETVDLNTLVAGMSDLLRHSIGGDVRLETVLAGGLWRSHVDPNQLENVILNLAVNARDAMPDGGRLTIETQNAHLDSRYAADNPGVPPGQYVLVAVTDTGSGMPDSVIAKAFDPFFTTKAVGKGTGLGLSQVYGFVKQSGGHVKIYSEPGQGTTVKVYLPRLVGETSDRVDAAREPPIPLGDAREVILVVEDEPSVRRFSVDALTELGYAVLEADGATAALERLDAHPEIALLFSDVVMPELNGRKLAEEARRRRPDLKVLFTTGYTRNAVVHNGVLDPGVQMIGKPFTIEDLASKVREVLDDPLRRSEASKPGPGY